MRDLRVLRASVEMFGIGSIVAVAIAYLFPALASAGPLGPVTQSVSRTATSNQMAPDLHKTWRKSMSRKLSLEMGGPIGCFHAKYPNSEWQTVPCGKARQGRHIPARGTHHPQIVGDAEDYSAQVSSLISSAEGSIVSFSGVTSIGAAAGPLTFQLNSNDFTTPICNGVVGCEGWQQFVYSTPGTGSPNQTGQGFIQDWLLNYGTPCPSGWSSYPGFPGDCVIISATAVTDIPDPDVPQLAQVSLIGMTTPYTDTVIVSTGTDLYAATVTDDIVDLSQGWSAAEFNIFGLDNGEEVDFNSGSTVVVKISVDDGTTNAPTCLNQGFTGETNNLTLDLCCPVGGASPALVFMESNVSGATSNCAILTNAPGTTLALSGTGSIVSNNQAIYQLTVSNTGAAPASNVVVSAQVPRGSTVPASGGNGNSPNCTAFNNSNNGSVYTLISCVISAVSANASQSWYVEVQLPYGDSVSGTALNFFVTSQNGDLTPIGGNVSITAVAPPPSTDGPLPLWALGSLGACLIAIASRRLKTRANWRTSI